MMQQNVTLSGRQAQFIDNLLASSTVQKAAELSHISRATAYRWLQDERVKTRYRSKLKELHQENMDKLIKSEEMAVTCLVRNLTAKSELVQVQAASKILEHVEHVYKVTELEALLDELKGRLDRDQLRRLK